MEDEIRRLFLQIIAEQYRVNRHAIYRVSVAEIQRRLWREKYIMVSRQRIGFVIKRYLRSKNLKKGKDYFESLSGKTSKRYHIHYKAVPKLF